MKWMVIAALLFATVAYGQSDTDKWSGFRPLEGRWTGEGEGFGSVSDVTHEWGLALEGHFLQLQTVSTVRAAAGDGEVHEDVGFLSFDTDRSSYVFRQFLSEGYVNTFDVSILEGENLKILFAARESESAGGMRAQMRLEMLSDSEYEMVLDLAMPGKDFSACQTMRMKRVD